MQLSGDQTTMAHTLTTLGVTNSDGRASSDGANNGARVERATETAPRAVSTIQNCWCTAPRFKERQFYRSLKCAIGYHLIFSEGEP